MEGPRHPRPAPSLCARLRRAAFRLDGVVALSSRYLPLYDLGLGWLLPALLGLVIGLVHRAVRRR